MARKLSSHYSAPRHSTCHLVQQAGLPDPWGTGRLPHCAQAEGTGRPQGLPLLRGLLQDRRCFIRSKPSWQMHAVAQQQTPPGPGRPRLLHRTQLSGQGLGLMWQQLPEVGVGDSSLLHWETRVLAGGGVGDDREWFCSVRDHTWAHGTGRSQRGPAKAALFEGRGPGISLRGAHIFHTLPGLREQPVEQRRRAPTSG